MASTDGRKKFSAQSFYFAAVLQQPFLVLRVANIFLKSPRATCTFFLAFATQYIPIGLQGVPELKSVGYNYADL